MRHLPPERQSWFRVKMQELCHEAEFRAVYFQYDPHVNMYYILIVKFVKYNLIATVTCIVTQVVSVIAFVSYVCTQLKHLHIYQRNV